MVAEYATSWIEEGRASVYTVRCIARFTFGSSFVLAESWSVETLFHLRRVAFHPREGRRPAQLIVANRDAIQGGTMAVDNPGRSPKVSVIRSVQYVGRDDPHPRKPMKKAAQILGPWKCDGMSQ